MTSYSMARSSRLPTEDMPSLYMMSNSALGEGRRDFVFDDFELGAVAGYGAVAALDLADAADVTADGGVEFEGASAGRGFGVAEHDADFFADLVGEDADGAGLGDEACEFAECGGHEACLCADGGVADVAFQFLAGDEGGHGVHDDDVDGVRADESFADLQGFFTGVRLGDEEVVEVDAELGGVFGVECVFHVDEGGEAACLLCLRDGGEGEGGFAGGFGAEYFDDAASREAARAEGAVDEKVAGGDDFDGHGGFVAEAHNGCFAKVFLDLEQGCVQSALPVCRVLFGFCGGGVVCHIWNESIVFRCA